MTNISEEGRGVVIRRKDAQNFSLAKRTLNADASLGRSMANSKYLRILVVGFLISVVKN